MGKVIKKLDSWVFPTVLILFILGIVTFSYVFGVTYAGRSEKPDHTLVYTKGSLTWNSATGINTNGVAELSLFDAKYNSDVKSEDGTDVVAPGTIGKNIVRLQNKVEGMVEYTTVLYQINSDEKIPVTCSLEESNFGIAREYTLPEGVKKNQVINAVKGNLLGGEIKDFDIIWEWVFFDDETQDEIDTWLGNNTDLDKVSVGLYIVVEDENSYITPDIPKTGDETKIMLYVALLFGSLMLVIVLVGSRRKYRCE